MASVLFMGLDAGTQGVRVIICDEKGNIEAQSSVSYSRINVCSQPGASEQEPSEWEKAAENAVCSALKELRKKGHTPDEIKAMSIDATCCTLVPVDRDGKALTNGIMYNDLRAEKYAEKIRTLCPEYEEKLGIKQNGLLGPARYLRVKEEMPEIYEKTALFVNQSDFLAGLFRGRPDISDSSCALKAGFDILGGRWPDSLSLAGIDINKLPSVSFTGEITGKVSRKAAERFGLSQNTLITAGSTDAYASAISSGIKEPGDWSAVLGTTLVLKGVTDRFRKDPSGVTVTHTFPGGYYLASGASNIGGICLNENFSKDEFAARNAAVKGQMPTGIICYPLTVKGERYPFLNPSAEPFSVGNTQNRDRLYTSLMEGVSYTCRLGLEHQESIGNPVGDSVFAAGGACRSDEWLWVMANVLGKTLSVTECPEAAFGMSIVSAMHFYGSLKEASANMVRQIKTVSPDPELSARYDDLYEQFKSECKKHFE